MLDELSKLEDCAIDEEFSSKEELLSSSMEDEEKVALEERPAQALRTMANRQVRLFKCFMLVVQEIWEDGSDIDVFFLFFFGFGFLFREWR